MRKLRTWARVGPHPTCRSVDPRRAVATLTSLVNSPTQAPRAENFGEFTALGVLGEGGSGTVYNARWGHRQVALKVMRAELPASERDRFLTEARLLMEITHPGVVKVLATGTLPDGRPYLAMELLRGESLAERLMDAAIPLPDALGLFVQLADAVAAMHARGLLHRDLKPENVMLVSDGEREHAVLLDFGIARAMERGEVAPTQTGIVRGTPAYMAPERFFGQPATVATDVYELAVTLFAMIAGCLPWADCIDPEVRLNPARLADCAQVPPALDAELARALSTRAGNRPPTVDALRDAVLIATGAQVPGPRQTADVAELALAHTVALNATPAPPRQVTAPRPSPGLAPHPSPSGMPAWTGGGRAQVTTGNAAGERPATGTTPARRRRWPWGVALGLAVGAAVAIPLALRGTDRAAHRLRPAPDDPWATPTTPPPGPARPVTPLEPGERTQIRRELADAARHAADDLQSVAGVAFAEVRADATLGSVVTAGTHSLVFSSISAMLVGHCDLDLAGRARWLVLGVGADGDFDLIAKGAWTREDIERCLMSGRKGESRRVAAGGTDDAITLVPLDGPDGHRWQPIGWLDDETFITTTRTGADADFIAARLAAAPLAHPSALTRAVDHLDRQATVWVATNRAGFDGAIENPALRGAELTARMALTDDNADFAVALTYADLTRATAAHDFVDRQLAALAGGGMLSIALPGLAVTRTGPVVHVVGEIPPALLGSLRDQLLKSMP